MIGIDDAIARSAGELTAHHRLRGYDAVHLASAIVAISDRGVLATWDRELADAAVGCGCTVAPA